MTLNLCKVCKQFTFMQLARQFYLVQLLKITAMVIITCHNYTIYHSFYAWMQVCCNTYLYLNGQNSANLKFMNRKSIKKFMSNKKHWSRRNIPQLLVPTYVDTMMADTRLIKHKRVRIWYFFKFPIWWIIFDWILASCEFFPLHFTQLRTYFNQMQRNGFLKVRKFRKNL